MQNRHRHILRKIILIILILIIVMCAGTGIYLSFYYHADADADAAADNTAVDQEEETEELNVLKQNDYLAFIPDQPSAGLIFYSGAKVEYTSYAPLMRRLADQGILCVLPHLTKNFAFLEMNAADGVEDDFPEIESWYIGGHSLGGVTACMYAQKHQDEFEGVILLASYSSVDLSETEFHVLSIYGSEDGVLSQKQYENARKNLPPDYEEVVIPGGCHAYFGNYGEQKGDGTPTISREEQQEETCEIIINFITVHASA